MWVYPEDYPWSNLYERQADEAFARAYNMSADQLRQIRPPLPQIPYIPPRFGYPTYVERQWTVTQVFGLPRVPDGSKPGEGFEEDRYQGSTRNQNADPLGLGGISW